MEFTKEIYDNLLLQLDLAHKKIDLLQSAFLAHSENYIKSLESSQKMNERLTKLEK